jgi:hypothetical protein
MKTFSVDFRVQSRSLSAAELESALGLEPDSGWTAGDLDARGRVRETSVWSLESEAPQEASLDAHVRSVCEQLAGKQSTIRELLERGDASACFCCACYTCTANTTVAMDRALLELLSSWPAEFSLSVYPCSEG